MPATHAAAVSAAIRKSGIIRPLPSGTPRDRKGVRVERGGSEVSVQVELPLHRRTSEAADAIEKVLTDAGYPVRRTVWDHPEYLTYVHVLYVGARAEKAGA